MNKLKVRMVTTEIGPKSLSVLNLDPFPCSVESCLRTQLPRAMIRGHVIPSHSSIPVPISLFPCPPVGLTRRLFP